MINSVLLKLCQERGAEFRDKGNGHFQIVGKLLVNYYPNSKRRSAYIAGTIGAKSFVSPSQAVAMAFEAPSLTKDQDKRKKNSRAKRYKMLKKHPFCHWCKAPLTLDNSTIEHLIPLARGGLDNSNNRRLACQKCNSERGHNMPELNSQSL